MGRALLLRARRSVFRFDRGPAGSPLSCRIEHGFVAAGKTDTREGARHRRLSRRRGKNKAVVATGNTQLRVLHVLLSTPGARYEDLGADYYERQREVARQVSHHVGKLGALGYEVTLCRLPPADPDTAEADAQTA